MGTDYIGAVTSRTNAVLAAPIVGNVDTVHLALVTGLVVIFALGWLRVLAHFSRG